MASAMAAGAAAANGIPFSLAVMQSVSDCRGRFPRGARTMKQATTILIAAGALLVGGIATAAFMNNRNPHP